MMVLKLVLILILLYVYLDVYLKLNEYVLHSLARLHFN